MRKKALGLVLSLALLAILSGTAAADVTLSPSSVTAELNLGESMAVDKLAHLDAFPPAPGSRAPASRPGSRPPIAAAPSAS